MGLAQGLSRPASQPHPSQSITEPRPGPAPTCQPQIVAQDELRQGGRLPRRQHVGRAPVGQRALQPRRARVEGLQALQRGRPAAVAVGHPQRRRQRRAAAQRQGLGLASGLSLNLNLNPRNRNLAISLLHRTVTAGGTAGASDLLDTGTQRNSTPGIAHNYIFWSPPYRSTAPSMPRHAKHACRRTSSCCLPRSGE